MTDEQLQQIATSTGKTFKQIKRLHNSVPITHQTEKDLLLAAKNPTAANTLKMVKRVDTLMKDYEEYKKSFDK